MSLQATTSHTVGPFFSIGLTRLVNAEIAGPGVAGERIVIEGRVLDGDGQPVPDALIELWQANSHGKYAHPEDTQEKPVEPGFKGYGRQPTDDAGKFRFSTIKPGPVQTPMTDHLPKAARFADPREVARDIVRALERRSPDVLYTPKVWRHVMTAVGHIPESLFKRLSL